MRRCCTPTTRITLVMLAMLVAGAPVVAETRFADAVVVSHSIDDDLYAAGGEIRIEGSVAGAAVLGAGSVDISGDVEGDVILASGRATLTGGVGDDLRIAAGAIRISGFVTDQATMAGGSVTIAPESAIGGRTWIAAGDVDMAGQIGDDLRIAAGSVLLSGRVAGNVEIAARDIRVAPGAVIGGDLVWRSEQPPEIAEDVHILGEVRAASGEVPGEETMEAPQSAGRGFAGGMALAAAALVLLWIAPRLVARLAAAFRGAPVRTLGLGFATLVLTPVVAVVLFITVLGWLLGVVVLAGYLFALLLSGLVGLLILAYLVGSRLERTPATMPAPGASHRWRTVMAVVAITVLLVLAQRVPVLGSLLTFFVVLAGLGAMTALLTGRLAPET